MTRQEKEAKMERLCRFPDCRCIVPDYAFSLHNRVDFCKVVEIEMAEPNWVEWPPTLVECQKGMTKDTCPYNPRFGCDCGANPPWI